MECKKGVCKNCGGNLISELRLIDSEVYCICRYCNSLRCCCSDQQEVICNEILKNEKVSKKWSKWQKRQKKFTN